MTTETRRAAELETLTIGVGGMTCASCVARVEKALKKVPGVSDASVNLASEKATVAFDPASTEVASLLDAIEAAGYELRERAEEAEDRGELERAAYQRELKLKWVVAGIVGFGLMLAGYWREFDLTRDLVPVQTMLTAMFLVALPMQTWAGSQFYVGMWKTLRHRTADMNTLIALGTSAAFIYSAVATF